MRYSLTAALGLTLALATSPALAQEFGRSGDVSFAADRLTGVYFADEGPDFTSIAIGGSPIGFSHPYTTARLGIDFFVIDHLSVGGSLGIFHINWDAGPGDQDATGFLLYPRVGYAINFNDTFGFWPRGGLTIRNGDDEDFWFFGDEVALSFEALFFATPDHWGFNFGPTLDAGIAGDGDEALSFGLITGGVFGWL